MKFDSFRRHVSARRLMKSSGYLAAGLLAIVSAAQARPVIPGAGGYGMETVAGRGGPVYRVTNLNASGSGSLKACIDKEGPRTCIFDVSGTIRITSDLTIRNDKITIAGQTAPSPGILIRGAAIKIQASDVLIQHIRVRTGDDAFDARFATHPLCPGNVATSAPLATSHTWIVLSKPAPASRLPSALHAVVYTGPAAPARVRHSLPMRTS